MMSKSFNQAMASQHGTPPAAWSQDARLSYRARGLLAAGRTGRDWFCEACAHGANDPEEVGLAS